MSQVLSTVTDVLHELRIDLQEFFWLVAQQLNIDAVLIHASDQVLTFTSDINFFMLKIKYNVCFMLGLCVSKQTRTRS